jgi:hypothetical protein
VASKVFLFDKHSWLYCSEVTHKNGIWSGWVENGAWYLHFDENSGVLKACTKRNGKDPVRTIRSATLTWACEPEPKHVGFGYNSVIENAKERYKNGEEANYKLTEKKKPVKEDYDDEVAF